MEAKGNEMNLSVLSRSRSWECVFYIRDFEVRWEDCWSRNGFLDSIMRSRDSKEGSDGVKDACCKESEILMS